MEAYCAGLARRQQFLQEGGQEEWPDGTVTACYAFRHMLYHHVVYAQLSAGRRISLKRRIDTRLEVVHSKQTDAIQAMLAEYFGQVENKLSWFYTH